MIGKEKFSFGEIKLYQGYNNFILGEPGIGKSFIAIHIAIYSALLGKKTIYWTCDMSKDIVKNRIYRIVQEKYLLNKDDIFNNLTLLDQNDCEIKELIEYSANEIETLIVDSGSSVYFDVDSEYKYKKEYLKFINKYSDCNCTIISTQPIEDQYLNIAAYNVITINKENNGISISYKNGNNLYDNPYNLNKI